MLCILTACQTDEYPAAGVTRTVSMTIDVTRQNDGTLFDGQSTSRATVSETDEGHLSATWESNDKIIVKAEDGRHMGTLSHSSHTSDGKGTFTGEVTTSEGSAATCHFFYLGSGFKTSEDADFSLDYSTQDGTLDWISKHDVYSATASVTFGETTAESNPIVLERPLAFGHFTLNFPAGVTYDNQPITISAEHLCTSLTLSKINETTTSTGDGTGKITITSATPVTVSAAGSTMSAADFYIAMIPATEAITPTFSVTIGEEEYTGSLGSHTWKANTFIREGKGEGVAVTMTAVSIEEDPDNPLSKFATSNLIRTSARGSSDIENGFADDPTHPGALFQWGRNYGFMPANEAFNEERVLPESLASYATGQFSHWADAFGAVEDFDGVPHPEYLVLIPAKINELDRNYEYTGFSYNNAPLEAQAIQYPASLPDYPTEEHSRQFLMMSGDLKSKLKLYPVDYWVFPIKAFSDSYWTTRAAKMYPEKPNPCPAGWRLPSSDEFRAILPRALSTSGQVSIVTANDFTELFTKIPPEKRTYKSNSKDITYAIRWLKNNNGIEVQAIVITDDTNIESVNWESKKVVKRIFPFTGRIEDYSQDNLFSLPLFPHRENQLESEHKLLNFEGVVNIGEFLGGYWLNHGESTFKFQTEEFYTDEDNNNGNIRASVEIGGDERPYAYAIRPVRDDSQPSNAKRK